ncbi:MAG: hypothetical protein HKN18_14645 [Silicimonas sp.]|nr:hypothetical protein [Silicimonas sp.]
MMNFFGPKGLRAEVTEGIDLEQGVTLTRGRIIVGSGPGDDLRLGAGDVVPGHLTFEKRADGKGWEYFTSDRGQVQIDRGNPRTGMVRAGMWFRLGSETRIDIHRVATPVEVPDTADDDAPKTIPLPLALTIMGAMAAAALGMVSILTSGGSSNLSLQTEPYVTGAKDLDPLVATCLEATGAPGRLVAPADPASPFWRVMAYRGQDPAKETLAKGDLTASVRKILAEAYFLSTENKPQEASEALRRLEYVLPVGTARCPILAASRFDVALLEMRGSR